MRPSYTALFLEISLLLVTSASTPHAASTPARPPSVVAHDLDLAWRGRVTPGATARMRALTTEARTHAALDYEATWRAARALWWLAHVEARQERRASLAREAAAAAERAIALQPHAVEGHFAYAAAIGEYGASIGAARALWEGVAPKFEHAAHAAYARDRDFEDGAPMLALGRYYFVLPWPLRDLEQSRRFLEELVARHPDALLGRVWLAETLFALGERDAAFAALESVRHAERAGLVRLANHAPKQMAGEMLDAMQAVRSAAGPSAPCRRSTVDAGGIQEACESAGRLSTPAKPVEPRDDRRERSTR